MEFMSIDLKPSECILLYLGCSLFFSDGVDRLPHLFIYFFFFYFFFFTNKRSITVTCLSQKQRQFNGKGIFIMSIDITI